MSKQSNILTGTHTGVFARKLLYYADFTTGTGVGSAILEVLVDGDWIPADSAVTATMAAARIIDLNHEKTELHSFRWSVTRSSGTIITYMQHIA